MLVLPSSPESVARAWRRAALVACAVAAVELVAVVVLAGLLLGRPFLSRATASPGPKPASKEARTATARLSSAEPRRGTRARRPAAPALSRGETSVLVLNGNGRTGAASAEAERVRSRGYPVAGVGNAPRSDYPRSLVMYRPGYEVEGRRLARDLGLELVVPLDGLGRGNLQGARAVVVVGRD